MSFMLNPNDTSFLHANKQKRITYSTCYYKINSKFPAEIYCQWISNLLFLAKEQNFNLVIYMDNESYSCIEHLLYDYKHQNIKIVIKPFESFYLYKYKDALINNNKLYEKHKIALSFNADWKLKMLWLEKLFFVGETIKNMYFETVFYGWCDIGYFRNRPNDTSISYLRNWSNSSIFNIRPFNRYVIHYGCIQNNRDAVMNIKKSILDHYTKTNEDTQTQTQVQECPNSNYNIDCFSGGFFILKPNLLLTYMKLFEEKLAYYLNNDFFIKDDQTIINDIIFTNLSLFHIHTENNPPLDNWFLFQRILA